MGVKSIICAVALDIERESYLRLEREPGKINNAEMAILAGVIGVKPNKFWFPPPAPGQVEISLDDLINEMPEIDRDMIVRAVRGMVGK